MRASLVFIDETGLLMTPLVRRSWAPRSQTPILHQRTRSRGKVSIIAALTVSPARRRVGLYFSLLANANVTTVPLAAFLRQLSRHIRGPMVVIWDRLTSHRARALRHSLRRIKRFHFEFLPPYAPELNPVEPIWSYLKRNPLANFAPADSAELLRQARKHVRRIQRDQDLLRSFLRSTPLFLRLK